MLDKVKCFTLVEVAKISSVRHSEISLALFCVALVPYVPYSVLQGTPGTLSRCKVK